MQGLGMYILEGKMPVFCDEIKVWGQWFEDREKSRVSRTTFGEVRVSTVFLGLDHSFGVGPPILFETIIFGGESDGYQQRCETWDQAEQMHRVACDLVGGEPDVEEDEEDLSLW